MTDESALPLLPHWIDGRSTMPDPERRLPVFDPATGKVQAEVPVATGRDVDRTVASAVASGVDWAVTPPGRRAEVMFAFRELLRARQPELIAAVCREHGKVPDDAAGEVARGLENVDFACGVPALLKGSFSPQVSSGVDVHSVREPVGVVVGITPFNFPVMVPLWMLANALACGNTFVLKPSERDPSASLVLAELLADAGLPPGVFSVLHGDRTTVDALIAHPDVAAVSFVGSTAAAEHVYARASAAGKRVQALGGAKNHLVVLPDADVGLAADGAVSAAFGSAGQRCMAVSVAVAVGDVADDLVEAIAKRLPGLRVGPASDPDAEMGPLIDEAALRRVTRYVAGAEKEGGRVVVDGRDHALAPTADPNGFFLGPTLIDDVAPGAAVYDDEIFGPVLAVVRVEHFDDAVGLVNANRYGNGAAVYTRDGGNARRFQREVTCGMVGVNVPIPVPVGSYSFGGWKSSLFGSARMYGPAGLDFYTREKVITTRWPDPVASVVDLVFPTR
ncbi:MAG: methylmalonate-semialdehyde dehydrogenase (acylating) [Acidimicrobiales bacterium]|nr:methylmalonate-semialdehyde dehydrogenase (acylating) [Acidimicrobiales bacterium]